MGFGKTMKLLIWPVKSRVRVESVIYWLATWTLQPLSLSLLINQTEIETFHFHFQNDLKR